MGGNSANIVSNANALGTSGGEENHTLTENEMPSHNHNLQLSSGQSAQHGQGLGLRYYTNSYTVSWNTNYISPSGGDQPHNNMPPYLIMNYIIKY